MTVQEIIEPVSPYIPHFRATYLILGAMILVAELIAIHNGYSKDTISERIWHMQETWTMGPWIRITIFAQVQWLAFHFLSNGKWGI